MPPRAKIIARSTRFLLKSLAKAPTHRSRQFAQFFSQMFAECTIKIWESQILRWLAGAGINKVKALKSGTACA